MEHFHTESIPDPDPSAAPENEGGLRRMLIDIIETVLLSVVLFLGINAVSARIRVESISMQPTLYAGDFVIVNKVAYKFGEVDRGDVIVFRFPPDPDREPYIKRIIGLPNDIVRVSQGKVYVNNNPLQEGYIKAAPTYEGEWRIPEGSLFVLGDNRNNSSDSHTWGTVPMEYVIGKALFVYWPLEEWGAIKHDATASAAP